MFRRLLIFVLAVASMAGCIKEKHDSDWTGMGCPVVRGVRVDLSFTYYSAGDGVDRLTDEVGDIRLYIFDGDGTLAYILDLDRKDIERGYVDIPLDPGTYTIVAWGSDSDDLLGANSGFSDSFAKVGVTTIDSFNLAIDSEDGVAPVAFDNLYHGMVGVTVTDREPAKVELDLVRHTNTLRILMQGLNHISRADIPVEVFVRNKYGVHTYNGSTHTDCQNLRHDPNATSYDETDNSAELDIKVLRLMASDVSAAEPMMLYICDPATGEELIDPLPVVETIMKSDDYNAQIDLDREQLFEIAISFRADLSVTVSVNGWIVTILDPVVEPWNPGAKN